MNKIFQIPLAVLQMVAFVLLLHGCASMGTPDGGAYDETPPRVVRTSPQDRSGDNHTKKITITFDEYVKLERANDNVVISPPQLEMPEIRSNGKRIEVRLKDTLKTNTTYTVDFGDAIVDNNEGNPLGQYTYSFSTGEVIDTMEVSGTVLDAETLEPIKGILVGLQSNLSDSAFHKLPFDRVARTNGSGKFIIRGIKGGAYHIFALKDANGNFRFDQNSETLAFTADTIRPSCYPAVRMDTLWRDSLHFDTIIPTPITRFEPCEVVLRAFKGSQQQQYLKKTERPTPEQFSFYFGSHPMRLPRLRGLNFDSDKLIQEQTLNGDTVTFWLPDSALIKMDTLALAVTYMQSDTLDQPVEKTDTLTLTPRKTLKRIFKEQEEEREEWTKEQRKRMRKEGIPEDELPDYPIPPFEYKVAGAGESKPNRNLTLTFAQPVATVDSSRIHLFEKVDTAWTEIPYLLLEDDNALRSYHVYGEWQPQRDYELRLDSMAFHSIYGQVTNPRKISVKIPSMDVFSTLYVNVTPADTTVYVQLLDGSEKILQTERVSPSGSAVFFFLKAGKYYLRAYRDCDGDGLWTTGDYDLQRQPEEMYYYPMCLDMREGWEIRQSWNLTETPLTRQKPEEITKQKPDKAKTIKNRNAERRM